MDDKVLTLVNRSYGQCCTSKGFFDDFYRNFFAMSKEVAQKLRNTELAMQKKLLRTGVGHLIMSYKGNTMSKQKMEKIGKSHSRTELNIPPNLYPLWKKAFLKTVGQHDPEISDEIKKAWVTVIDQGIGTLSSKY